MTNFQVTWKFTYTENIIPPRCRKPRPKKFQGEYTVEIPALSDKEAPVAIIETDKNAAPEMLGGERRTRIRQYRWYNNQLWCDHKIDRFKDIEFESIQPVITGYGSDYQSLDQHQEQARLWAKSKILVDGIVHKPLRGEPRLLVNRDYFNQKFYVSLERHFDYDVPRFKFSDFYRLDQINEAIAKCHRWFERFQNDKDEVELIIPYEFEIIIPQAIQLNPQAEQAVADEEKFQTNLQKLISETKSLFADHLQRCRALKEALATFEI
ncbi:MAG: hypothetical protein KME46_21375 [Brasilonema angustatum HA4187-MV1]|jgi:hypothetical protein|nr:hypothetical protein [Brasilonema angustatum HA4187-MV1]